MTITLRPYQTASIESVKKDWAEGMTDCLLTMATGGGKTAVFLSLLNQVLEKGKRALIIAHRQELIYQPKSRMIDYYPQWEGHIGIMMAEANNTDQPITIATIQTLVSGNRLAALLSHGQIDYLITDEAHHVTDKNTYKRVLDGLRAANPGMKHLGVTATPIRADGDGLVGVFQKESAHFGIVELIQDGFLVPVRWLAIQTAISLKDVPTNDGDFVAKRLADVFETDNCFELVVESHLKYANGRQAVAFTVSVDGAYRLAEEFRKNGITAVAADATTPKKDRQIILDDFRAGKTTVLCNVGLFTEGLDIPEVSCIHQVRPTKSDNLYTQMIGRSLRIFPGKTDALILDYAPAETRNIAMAGDVLGIPLRKDAYIEKEKEEIGDVLGGFTFDGKVKWMSGNPAEIVSRELNYIDTSPYIWYRDGGVMSLGLGEGSDHIERILLVTAPKDGQVELYLVAKRPQQNWKAYLVMTGEFEKIAAWSDDYAVKRGNAILVGKKKTWRKQSPSEAQIKYAKRFKGVWREGVSKGELANRINHTIAWKSVESIRIATLEVKGND